MSKAAHKAQVAQIKAVMAHALRSESTKSINACLDSMRSEPDVAIPPDMLDRDHWLWNCPNGTLDLRTGVLREHRREDFITKLCPHHYDADAECPTWARCLSEWLQGDGELIAWLQKFMGYSLTGSVREQIMPVFWGGGRNGKTTCLVTIGKMMGADYCIQAAHDFLMLKAGDSHPTASSDLFGKRLAFCIETADKQQLNEVFVKMLTGGDKIRTRRMREDFWEYEPTHKIILATNSKPVIKGQDEGIWRRFRLVPWTAAFSGENDDKEMPTKLDAELPGILAWAVRGAMAWQQDGLGLPAVVKHATAEYRTAEDLLGQFVSELCVTGAHYKCKSAELYARFKSWADAGGEKPITQTAFGIALGERGYEKRTSNGVWYCGIALNPMTDMDGIE